MAEENNSVLHIEDLTVNYVLEDETVYAVKGISLDLKKGQSLGLVGETGAGKTTTALSVMHLIPSPPGRIETGSITLRGHDMVHAPQDQLKKIRGKEVSMIFQDPMTSLNPVYTVGAQIAESIMLHEGAGKEEAMRKAGDMLELVGIPRSRAADYPHQFSGGMRQRVVIAIALACNPQVLIADEPTTALDVTIQAQVLELMRKLRDQYGTALIMITHDLGIVAEICDSVAVMYAGQIVEKGTLEDIYDRTAHPYTAGLFNSLPNIKSRKNRLKPIHGLTPDPTVLSEGCYFAERCPYATERCRATKPSVHRMGDTHEVLCVRYDEPGFHVERD